MHQTDVVHHHFRVVFVVNKNVSYRGHLNVRRETAPAEKTGPQLVVVFVIEVTAMGCGKDLRKVMA